MHKTDTSFAATKLADPVEVKYFSTNAGMTDSARVTKNLSKVFAHKPLVTINNNPLGNIQSRIKVMAEKEHFFSNHNKFPWI